ncbi:hypothetical protein MMC07_004686 [Pseudocyphellaria aurata]|nr:hypothetical protein [Pseudocyphellaria aurata]
MPSSQLPLRQYPSAQTMRQVDGSHRSPGHETVRRSQENESYDRARPLVNVHDFQTHHWTPSSRPSTPGPIVSPRLNANGAPPLPDSHQRWRHTPAVPNKNSAYPLTSAHDQQGSSDTSPASATSSNETYETQATSLELPALQAKSALEQSDQMQPLTGDLVGSFDLVAAAEEGHHTFSLEMRSEQLFSREHLEVLFSDPSLLLRFTAFLSTHRPQSVPILIYYLDALKALKAIKYANAIAEALSPISGYEFTNDPAKATANRALEEKAAQAFDVLVRDDLPAYITQLYIQIVSLSISRRITGTLAPHLREASEGLAEVFCLTDPSRPDNPIVFTSEEFHRTTQYGVSYAIGRNCRFLQGPKTNPLSVKRIHESVEAGKEHCEVFLNYRRDGSPFMNLLMIAPLCDSRGKIRYHIGAQVDVSGLVKDCTDLESLQRLVLRTNQHGAHDDHETHGVQGKGDEFQDLSEMLNIGELDTVRKWGGRMHREYQDDEDDSSRTGVQHMPRLLLKEPNVGLNETFNFESRLSGKLSGIYQNYLLIRPYPSLRILFASPSLRVPGILQSPFMNKIGGSTRVQDELNTALAEGRGVTAKVRWVSKADEDGRNRWIHCTPLLGSNGQIGVWMVVLVDDDHELSRRWKQAPPVGPHRGKLYGSSREGRDPRGSNDSYATGGLGGLGSLRGHYATSDHNKLGMSAAGGSIRSSSPNSVRIF